MFFNLGMDSMLLGEKKKKKNKVSQGLISPKADYSVYKSHKQSKILRRKQRCQKV